MKIEFKSITGETRQAHDIPEWNELEENQRANLLSQFMYHKPEPLPSNIIPFDKKN